jgi:hypothetical protein
MLAPDRREALEIEDAIVGIGWRLAHEHAGRRLDRVFQRFVVARGDGGHLDAVAGQHAVEKLARVPVAVVGDDDMSTAREQREERGRHGAHPAREHEAVAGALERGELQFRDALRRVAVPAVVDALVDLAVEVILHFLAGRPRVRRRLYDRHRQRVRRLPARLATVHRHRARSEWFLRRLERIAHQDDSSFVLSTWRAMARATRFGSAGSSTGLLRCVGLTPSSAPM